MAARILVISGNSNTGAEAIRQLREKGVEVRAGVRNLARASNLSQLGAEVVEADLDRPETLPAAVAGIEKILLSTAAALNLPELHGRLYGPAKDAGVRHVVRISAVGANPKAKVPLGQLHGKGEQGLEESGLAWTHLRPHSFLQNYIGAVKDGKLYDCIGSGKVPHVDVRDIAASAVACLLQDGHEGKAYEITGPKAVTMQELAAMFGAEYVDLPMDQWISAGVAAGLPEWLAKDLGYLHGVVFAKGYASKVSPAVGELTGRDPISPEQFARDYMTLKAAG